MNDTFKKLTKAQRATAQDLLGQAATLPASELKPALRIKLPVIMQMIDEAVMHAAGEPSPLVPAPDRLFDILMLRLESLQPWRAGVIRITTLCRKTPELAFLHYSLLKMSLRKMLDTAKIKKADTLQLHILLGVYYAALIKWEGDQSADLSKTMATLNTTIAKLLWLKK